MLSSRTPKWPLSTASHRPLEPKQHLSPFFHRTINLSQDDLLIFWPKLLQPVANQCSSLQRTVSKSLSLSIPSCHKAPLTWRHTASCFAIRRWWSLRPTQSCAVSLATLDDLLSEWGFAFSVFWLFCFWSLNNLAMPVVKKAFKKASKWSILGGLLSLLVYGFISHFAFQFLCLRLKIPFPVPLYCL